MTKENAMDSNYFYITMRRLPGGTWVDAPSCKPLPLFDEDLDPSQRLESRRSILYGESRSGNSGVQSVTKIKEGGTARGSEKFLRFFDYTIDFGYGTPVRFREGVVAAK